MVCATAFVIRGSVAGPTALPKLVLNSRLKFPSASGQVTASLATKMSRSP
jgi:hypothetical protein